MARGRIVSLKPAKAKRRGLLAHIAGKKRTQVMSVSGMDGSSTLSLVHIWLFLSFFPTADDLLPFGRKKGWGGQG